jgi:hypothetical protein
MEGSLRVHHETRKAELYSNFDHVHVSSTIGGDHDFKAHVSADVDQGVVLIRDPEHEHAFALSDVQSMEIWEYAPWRPWLILGATLGGGVLGAALGAASSGCNRGPEEDGCPQNGVYGSLGFVGGAAAGLALSISLTDIPVRERPRRPNHSTAPTSRRPR